MADFPITAGTDNLKGTKGDDRFTLDTVGDLTASDKITGGGGNDQIVLKDNSNGTIKDAAYAGVNQVQTVTVDHVQGFLEIGALAAKAGINTVDGIDTGDTLEVDASAYTNAAGLTVIGNGEFMDLTGSKFGDTFKFAVAAVSSFTHINGGAGSDTLQVTAVGDKLEDADLLNIVNIDRLLVTGDAAELVLGVNASANGINLVEGQAVTDSLSVDGSTYSADGLTVNADSSNTIFTGSGFNDVFLLKSGVLSGTQHVFNGGKQSGGAGDVLSILGDGKTAVTLSDAALKGITNTETLRLSGSPTATVTLGQNSDKTGFESVDGTAISGTFTVDASARTNGITILSGAGVNNLTGGIGDDDFVFTSKGLTATDKVDGKGIGDDDRIVITDKAAILDAVLAKVTNVEEIAVTDAFGPVADYAGAKVTLGAFSVTNKLTTVTNETDYALAVDVSARGTNATVFNGGTAADSLITKLAAFVGAAEFSGGGGDDEVHILDAFNAKDANTKIVAGDFNGMGSVERLVFDASGAQNVKLDQDALDAGLNTVDASKVTGGILLDATAFSGGLDVILGSGKDTYLAGSSSNVFVQSTKLNGDDTVDAGGGALIFTDAVKIVDKYFAPISTGKISDADELILNNTAAGQTFVAGTNFGTFVDKVGVGTITADAGSSSSFTFDFKAYNGDPLTINGGEGSDVFIGGQGFIQYNGNGGNDSFRFSSDDFGAFQGLDGGDGTDEWVILDAGANPGPVLITDGFFNTIDSVEVMRLAASKTGSYEVELGSDAFVTGIQKVDASLAGVNVKINALNLGSGATFLLSGKDNNILGSNGLSDSNLFVVDAKTLNASDIIDGGDGFSTLRFSTGGAVTAASLAGLDDFNRIELSDAGNSVVVNKDMTGFIILAPVPLSDGTPSVFALFSVIGGKGNDTVDFSQMTLGGNVALAGSGNDTFIGSAGFDTFIFEHQADLTTADKVDGGGDDDIVIGGAGTWSSDTFKGFKNVEEFRIFDADFSKDSTVVLKDAFFQSSVSAGADGIRTFTVGLDERMVSDDRLDASQVTSAMNTVVFSFAVTFGGSAFAINEDDTVIGGAGWDSVELANLNTGGTIELDDIAFSGVSSVEALRISDEATGGATLHLGANMEAAGLQEVDASESGQNLILDVVGFQDGGVKVKLGDNVDDVTLSGGDDVVTFTNGSFLGSNDSIDGNGGNNDRIEFVNGQVGTGAFKGVVDMDVVALIGSADSIVVDADVIKAGIKTIDASQAQQAVLVTDSSGGGALTIFGSSFGDEITGSSKNDVIYGGLGKDVLKGNGSADTFVYTNVTDSRQGPAGDIEHMDFISDFNAANDKFDFTVVLGTAGSTAAIIAPGTFTNADVVADFFTKAGKSVAAQFDTNFDLSPFGLGNGATRIYVDANGNGDLDLAEDLVVMVAGDQTSGLSVGEFVGVFLDPLRPVLEESNAIELKTAGTFTDADWKGDNDALVLSATKGDYKLTLAEPATNGFRFIDGSVVGGLLTVDASKHFDPVYIASGKGKNDLTGTAGDDVFYFTNAGLSGDKVNGGPDTQIVSKDDDVIFITDKSALVDAAFANVKNVEILEFGLNPIPGQPQADVTGQKVVLGLKSEAAGITTIINDWVAGLTVDASARTQGVTFKGGAGADVFITNADDTNAFFGGGGNDSFRSTLANFNDDQQVDGGLGSDEIRILDSDNGKSGVNDADFANVDSVERLVFDATGKQFVTLDSSAGEAGIELIDGSKVTGGLDITIGNNIDHEVTVIAGTGKDKITLGADGGDILIASTKLTKDDVLDGGGNGFLHFTDAVKLTDAYFGGIKDVVKNFSGTELDLDNDAKGQTLVAGVNYADFVNNSGMNSVVAKTTQGFTADFTNYLATGGTGNTTLLTFIGGEGNDVVTLDKNGFVSVIAQGGDDTVKVGSAALLAKAIVVNGGDGSDRLLILDADTFLDAQFANIAETEILVLGASKTGEYHLVGLDSEFTGSGIATIDGSLAGVLVDIDATKLKGDMTLIAGGKNNFISAGDGNDTIVYDAKTFDGGDDATGGTSNDGDTLKFSSGGVINTAAFAAGHVLGIEKIAFSDAGNSLVLTNAVVSQENDVAVVDMPDGQQSAFDFAVLGGKGNDTVDFSAVTAKTVAVFGNGGNDKFTGGAGEDVFVFPLAGDLTSADTVKGGGDTDTLILLAGTYKADAFKGVSSIERIAILDPTGESDASIALNNDFFKGIDPEGGFRNVLVQFDPENLGASKVDASAVTDATASVTANMGGGADTFLGGAGRDNAVFFEDTGGNILLDSDDSGDGGLGWDTLTVLYNKATAFDDSALSGFKHFEQLSLKGGAITVDLTDFSDDAGIQMLDASGLTGGLDLNAGTFGNDLTVKAGAATDDNIQLGNGDDVVWYESGASALDKTETVTGSNGDNTLRFSGDTTLVDDQFTGASNFQTIELVDGKFNLTLGTEALGAGVQTVDASEAGQSLTLNAGAFAGPLTVIGSDAADTIAGGKAVDTIQGGAGGDSLSGGTGGDAFLYTNTDDSRLISLGDLSATDKITGFSDAEGDTINLDFANLSGITDAGSVVDLAGLIGDGSLYAAAGRVTVLDDGTDTFIFVDTNNDNFYSAGSSDLVIKVVGVAGADRAALFGDIVI